MYRIYNVIELLRNSLTNETEINYEKYNWDEIYETSAEHGVNAIIFSVLDKSLFKSNSMREFYDKWKKSLTYSVVKQIQINFCIDEITNLLTENKIKYIVIKGPSIARYYTNPQLRFMGDIDILVSEEDVERSISVLKNNQFILLHKSEKHPIHFELMRKGYPMIEVHKGLINTNFLGKRKICYWNEMLWKSKLIYKSENSEYYTLSPEDEIIYQIIHFATHYVYTGAQLKHIYDIAIIIKNCKIDLNWEYIFKILKNINFSKFSEIVFTICVRFFDLNIPISIDDFLNKTSEEFIEKLHMQYLKEKKYGEQKGWSLTLWFLPKLSKTLIVIPIVFILELFFNNSSNSNDNNILARAYANTIFYKEKIAFIKKIEII